MVTSIIVLSGGGMMRMITAVIVWSGEEVIRMVTVSVLSGGWVIENGNCSNRSQW